MNFFKKLFQQKEAVEDTTDVLQQVISNIPLDDNFVQNFIQKGGKFFILCSSGRSKSKSFEYY